MIKDYIGALIIGTMILFGAMFCFNINEETKKRAEDLGNKSYELLEDKIRLINYSTVHLSEYGSRVVNTKNFDVFFKKDNEVNDLNDDISNFSIKKDNVKNIMLYLDKDLKPTLLIPNDKSFSDYLIIDKWITSKRDEDLKVNNNMIVHSKNAKTIVEGKLKGKFNAILHAKQGRNYIRLNGELTTKDGKVFDLSNNIFSFKFYYDENIKEPEIKVVDYGKFQIYQLNMPKGTSLIDWISNKDEVADKMIYNMTADLSD